MEVILVRHAQSESNARLTDDLDAGLTDLGRRQANATANYLAYGPVLRSVRDTKLYVSPFRRTLQTCEAFAAVSGLQAHAYPRVCEYFAHTNHAYDSFVGIDSDTMRRLFPFAVPGELESCGGRWWPERLEDPDAMYKRAIAVRDELIRQFVHTDTQIVIFSHADPIGRMIEALQHIAPSPEWPPWSENCGISRLIVGSADKPAEALILNDTSHLQALGLLSPVLP